jgi:hypothetical protein
LYANCKPHRQNAANGSLPLAVATKAASAQAIATDGVVNIAALDVTKTKASGVGEMQVGASCAKAVVAAVDEVAVRQA